MPGEIHDVLVAIRGLSPMDAPIWAPISKMGLEWYCMSLQQSIYMRDSF